MPCGWHYAAERDVIVQGVGDQRNEVAVEEFSDEDYMIQADVELNGGDDEDQRCQDLWTPRLRLGL